MPATHTVVYAQWEELWYLVEIDPNGGEFQLQSTGEDNSGYSTWFWLNYGDLIEEYTEVTRDYEASSDGTYYYKYYDRTHYGLGDEYESREDSYTDRSAGYTTSIGEATDLSQRYEVSPGAYRYAGWFKVENDGSEAPYNFETPVQSNVYLKLHWKSVGIYYIQYNPAGGTLDNNDLNEEQFKDLDNANYADKARIVVMRTVVDSPDDKNFIGWRLRNDPSGTLYYPGGAFEFNAAYAETTVDEHGNERKYMVLDAVYQAIDEPELIYDANGGTMTSTADHGSGTFLKNVSTNNGVTTETELTDSEKYQYNTDAGRLTVRSLVNNTQITLSNGSGFSYNYSIGGRTGNYVFSGWNTKPDGSGTHYDAGSNIYIDNEEDNPVILYAEWKVRVYFDKNNDNANWGGDWTASAAPVYTDDNGQYYTEILLNSQLSEPSYIPVASDKVFYNWSTTHYTDFNDNTPFDFSEPVTQDMIDTVCAAQGSTHITLYAIWNIPPEVTLHAVDSSAETLVLKDNDWRNTDHFTINSNGTPTSVAAYSDVSSYADPNNAAYKYAFACVSDSLENVSDENRITNIFYNTSARRVYVTYEGGTTGPLEDGEEIYLVYYTAPVNIGYVVMNSDGSLTPASVSGSAPTSANINGTYVMASNLTAPLSWEGTHQFYSYAIGDELPAVSPDSSIMHVITESSSSDSSRPELRVRDSWRGFEYSTDGGSSWTNAGYDIELYAIYYANKPTIVTLNEQTIGYPDDMDTEFTYTVRTFQQDKTVTEYTYYYRTGSIVRYSYNKIEDEDNENATIYRQSNNRYPIINDLQLSNSVTNSSTELSSNTVDLSDGQSESFTLFYSAETTGSTDSYTAASSGGYNTIYYYNGSGYYQIFYKSTTKHVIDQTIEIVQTPKTDFATAMIQSPVTEKGIIDQSARKYTYTAANDSTVQSVTYTNTRESSPVEVHVAIASGNGYYKHDGYRTDTQSSYKGTVALGSSITLQSSFPSNGLLASEYSDSYVFAGIIYGKEELNNNHVIDVEDSGITTVTYGQTDSTNSPNIYELYLNNDTQKRLGDNEIYYVYYKRPVITYWYEDGNGTLTKIDPVRVNGAALTLNGQVVAQDSTLPIDGNLYHEGSEFVISQAGSAYKVPPTLDSSHSAMPVEYAEIGVGTPDELLHSSENKELRLSVENGIVKYRFSSSDTSEPFDSADDMVVYVIYKGGNNLTISKTINRIKSQKGNPTFQFRIRRTADIYGTPLDPVEERVVSLSFTETGTRTASLPDLAPGSYEITELSNINYTLSDIFVSPNSAGEASQPTATATVTIGTRSEVTVSFTNSTNSNTKKTYQTFTDNHIDYTGQ